MNKICVVTGTRAEYGLLYWIMKEIQEDPELKLQVVVAGMHLSPQFGSTYKLIEEDGFHIDQKVEMFLADDSALGISRATGEATQGFAEAFEKLKPNMVVVLGDRFEVLAAATAALISRIPIAHIHGGETTLGAFDDSIRHAITKMSYLHFAAAEPYRSTIIQMGEDPARVFSFGAPGLDNVDRLSLLSKEELEKSLGFSFQDLTFLVTYHPVTLDEKGSQDHVHQLLAGLDQFPKAKIIFTQSNADPDNKVITDFMQAYVSRNKGRAVFFASLGQARYLSVMKHVDVVIGNSSSGIIEAPSFKKATVNIGDRQKGRLMSDSIISCEENVVSIVEAIRKAINPDFQSQLIFVKNLYGSGGASLKIKNALKSFTSQEFSLKKEFFHSRSKRVLVIAPHPDDETLGAGGALLRHRAEGDEINWLIMTHIKEDTVYPEEFKKIREEEIQKIVNFYGFKRKIQFPYHTTKLDTYPAGEVIGRLSQVINEIRPDVMYVPNRSDIHSDHRMTFEYAMACSKTFRFPFLKKVLMYETISETDLATPFPDNVFTPNVFVDVTLYVEKKLKAMKIYQSELGEHPFPRSLEALKALTILRGSVAHVKHAEAFMLLKEV
ncbi:MAG: UDP-N-acetylglucosamine 2-epimerase (hydrolyzing) [Deltaproteobacteria bacterium]|nr:UDP-N-acetylglucosamine 2-epimerase (hydrolyzing) [Deltaproteobacteria bacterium]